MPAKPGKDYYTRHGSYQPIALLKTIGKVYEKTLTKYLFAMAEGNDILHPGHYGARPSRLTQDALVHLV